MNVTPPQGDDDSTVMPQRIPEELVTAISGDKPMNQNSLPIGSKLGEFEIVGLIGAGGFGIVYLAYDHSLHRQVALKEYMPAALAGRDDSATVVVRSERNAETFQAGLRSFVNEAQLLAQFDHPALVKVYRFWESNGTAYMVMPFYQGVTLKETLALMSSPPDEAWLKGLLAQLLEALGVIHANHCLHRDIAPDNILILPDGRPLLLDFGAARRVIGNMTQALTVILKPGYAPVEQYADDPTMRQGPWTDIYALAAVAYFAITGHPPAPSVGRMMSDSLIPLSKAAAGRYSAQFLNAIDLALEIKPENRPQNVMELRTLLGLTAAHQDQRPPTPRHEPAGAAVQVIADKSTIPKQRAGAYIAVFVMLLVAVGTGFFLLRNKPAEMQPTETGAATSSVATAPEIIGARQFDPMRALDEVFEGRERNHAVTVSTEKAQTRIGKDLLRFRIRSARAGYVYLLMVGTNRSDFFLLFPNAVDKSNNIKAGEQFDLPRPEWKMVAEGPPGTDHFVVIVSDRPRDFSAAGLAAVDPFAEFPLDKAARLYSDYTGSTPLFAGKAICPTTMHNCSESYGAAMFSIEEIRGA
jgi:serine/threonine protein kinase